MHPQCLDKVCSVGRVAPSYVVSWSIAVLLPACTIWNRFENTRDDGAGGGTPSGNVAGASGSVGGSFGGVAGTAGDTNGPDMGGSSSNPGGKEILPLRPARCARFRSVGVLPNDVGSYAEGLSGDGKVVVGSSIDSNGRKFAFQEEWESTAGPLMLPGFPEAMTKTALAVSHDGYAVVGSATLANGSTRAFRWTLETGMVNLGLLFDDDESSIATGVSDDGKIVVGDDIKQSSHAAFQWRPGEPLARLEGIESVAALSGDGSRALGRETGELFIWERGGRTQLKLPAADDTTSPDDLTPVTDGRVVAALSTDGKVVVTPQGEIRGLRWTDDSDVSELPDLRPLDVNEDGSVIVGVGGSGPCGGDAAVWFENEGAARTIACDVLPSGLVPQGWRLTAATAVSDDGIVVAGHGISPTGIPQGWVAVLGVECPAERPPDDITLPPQSDPAPPETNAMPEADVSCPVFVVEPSQEIALCRPSIVANQMGVTGQPADVYDGSIATGFVSAFDNWQYVEIDLGCVQPFRGLRRHMSSPIVTSTTRIAVGEAVSYSADRETWTELTAPTSRGWEAYLNYGARQQAWQSTPYGWSAWLVSADGGARGARFVRYSWDAREMEGGESLNEVRLDAGIIYTLLASGRCLSVPAGSTEAVTSVGLSSCVDADSQRWRINLGLDGHAQIASAGNGYCLDAGPSQEPAGGPLQASSCNDASTQRWDLRVRADGTYAIISLTSRLCLALPSVSPEEGAVLQVLPCNCSSTQGWLPGSIPT